MLKDGSGRVCIHWLRYVENGKIPPMGSMVKMSGDGTPMSINLTPEVENMRREIACRPEQNSVNPQIHNGATQLCMRTDEPRGEFPMDDKLLELLVGQAPQRKGRFVKVPSILAKK